MVRCIKYLDFRKFRYLGFVGRKSLLPVKGAFEGTYILLNARPLCSSVHPPRLSWGASSQEVLNKNIETALEDHRIDDAWVMFKDLKRLYGLPENSILNKFVTLLAYSDSGYLHKASELVHLTMKQNRGLLRFDVLTKLLLSLSRAQMPEAACNILRAMLDMSYSPSLEVLRLVVMHMVKSKVGTCLASNYLVQLCDAIVDLDVRTRLRRRNVVKPDTLLFNLVLNACVRFGFSFKGQELVELMAKTDIIADAYTIVIISCLYEMNGMRDELKKFKEHIDHQVPALLLFHYRHFYDNLLSLEFKFDDIDSAGRLVLDICKTNNFLSVDSEKPPRVFPVGSDHIRSGTKIQISPEKTPRVLPVGSDHIRSGIKIQISPECFERDSSLQMEKETELIDFANAKLVITNKALAKLIYGYKRHGNVSELSKVLFLVGGSRLCADTVNACVDLGWLETAHDILDDMESSGHPMGLSSYTKLLSGYHEQEMLNNAEALLKQMKKAETVTDQSAETKEMKSQNQTELYTLLVQEMKCQNQKEMRDPHTLYELNSSLYYFCKAKMREDGLRAFRKIQKMKITPNLQSFWIMIHMYSSLGMYRDITIVWGDMKRNMERKGLRVTEDLLEKLVINFLRGGYFERVMEIMNYMKENDMFMDLSLYKTQYLKLHKSLYRDLRSSQTLTEAQSQRLHHVLHFKKLVGLL